MLRKPTLEEWNIEERLNLREELPVDVAAGMGAISRTITAGCTVNVYFTEIEDTCWDIPASDLSTTDPFEGSPVWLWPWRD
jgi:hypothetical protein